MFWLNGVYREVEFFILFREVEWLGLRMNVESFLFFGKEMRFFIMKRKLEILL